MPFSEQLHTQKDETTTWKRGKSGSNYNESGDLKNLGICFPEVKEPAVRNKKQSYTGLGWESVRECRNPQSESKGYKGGQRPMSSTHRESIPLTLACWHSIHTGLDYTAASGSQILPLCFGLLRPQGPSSRSFLLPLSWCVSDQATSGSGSDLLLMRFYHWPQLRFTAGRNSFAYKCFPNSVHSVPLIPRGLKITVITQKPDACTVLLQLHNEMYT